MVSTTKFIGYVVPMVLVVILGSFDATSASKQCKSTVMNVVMRQCSDVGTRVKRELEPPEVRTQRIEPDEGIIQISEYPHRAKRQLDSYAAIASVAAPIVSDVRTSVPARRGHLSPMGGSYATGPYPYPVRIAAPYPGVPRYVAAAPPRAPTLFRTRSRVARGFLPQASGDSLGFELSMDEMDELYNEVAERITRNSPMNPDEAKRLFLETAAKCCQNEELCLKEQNLRIPCV